MRAIVTTTINPPTEALEKYASLPDWHLIVVGDKKTPHKAYRKLRCRYLSPDDQEALYPKLSKLIGWNCIQRRNIGFVLAYQMGAEIIATVDDDNIPYKEWGKNLFSHEAERYGVKAPVFDPLSVTSQWKLWHRGYPLQLLEDRLQVLSGKKIKKDFLVQADLWDGDPDIDAIGRIAYHPDVKFEKLDPFFSDKPSPFNSQNTFLKRKVLPYYFMFPGVGRMDDIYASYYVQSLFPQSVVYCKASVIQKRNQHNLVNDLKAELHGYENALSFALKPDVKTLPQVSQDAFKEYQRLCES